MTDDFDDLLHDAARSYNTPPTPPREAMWDAIARARDAATVVPLAQPRRTTRWIATAAGIAAVLMVGVVIGRASRAPELAPAGRITASADPVDSAVHARSPDAPPAASPSAGEPGSVDAPPAIGGTRRVAAGARGAVRSPAATGRERESTLDISGDAGAYRLAVVEHLTRTELLLTSFRAKERTGAAELADAQFATLSKELLGTTRLLLATRQNDDPVITRLLQDLEYVLMQLSQYANDGRRADLDAINQSLDKRNVLPKLRSNIPAGVPALAGT